MFKFRLQKVLDYRSIQTDEARQRLLAASAARVEGENALGEIDLKRRALMEENPATVFARIELEARLTSFDDQERGSLAALSVLKDEELTAKNMWIERKRELETIQKLRTKAHEAWQLDENRKEQGALDEWAVLRRAA